MMYTTEYLLYSRHRIKHRKYISEENKLGHGFTESSMFGKNMTIKKEQIQSNLIIHNSYVS